MVFATSLAVFMVLGTFGYVKAASISAGIGLVSMAYGLVSLT